MLRSMPMHRVPLTLRALVLVPLFALGADHARASLACGPGAESCLQASGHGWLGVAGVAVLLLYAAGLAVAVGRLATGRAPGFLRLWLLATAGVAGVCAGQALLAAALGDGAALGGGWTELVGLCVVAGAAVALALRAAPAAAALVRSLRPPAPRPRLVAPVSRGIPAPPARRPRLLLALAAPSRGPPALG
jgi:hypothetical protein